MRDYERCTFGSIRYYPERPDFEISQKKIDYWNKDNLNCQQK